MSVTGQWLILVPLKEEEQIVVETSEEGTTPTLRN
jgi:hypothetical protein